MYKKASGFKKLRQEAADERNPRKVKRNANFRRKTVKGREMRSSPTPQPTSKRKPIDMVDPPLLWFLNTVGCRHRLILSYLEYPDVFDDGAQNSWCCDRCAIAKGLDPDTTVTAGVALKDCFRLRDPDLSPASSKRSPMIPTIRKRKIKVAPLVPLISQDLKNWRKKLWQKLVNRGVIWDRCVEEVVLPDNMIKKLVKGIRVIHNSSDITIAFENAKFNVGSSLLRDKDIIEIFNIIEARIAKHTESGIYSDSHLLN